MAHLVPTDSLTNVGQSPGETRPIAIERPTGEPGTARPTIPGEDPVVQREAEERQTELILRRRRHPFERVRELVGEIADEPAKKRGRRGARRILVRSVGAEPSQEPTCRREWVQARSGLIDDRERIGRQVAPSGVPSGTRTLEEGDTGKITECLGDVDRTHAGDAGKRLEVDDRPRGTFSRGEDHPAMIGRRSRVGARRGVKRGGSRWCERVTWGSRSVVAGPGP
jgi:hypothetical protein